MILVPMSCHDCSQSFRREASRIVACCFCGSIPRSVSLFICLRTVYISAAVANLLPSVIAFQYGIQSFCVFVAPFSAAISSRVRIRPPLLVSADGAGGLGGRGIDGFDRSTSLLKRP